MKVLQRLGILFLFCSLGSSPSLVHAQDVQGSKDHPLISRYPGSTIDDYSQKAYDEYTLPLGKMGAGEIEKSQHLEGKFTRIHYLISSGRSTLEVMRNYQDALQRAGFQTLFTCALAQCGTGYFEGVTGWCGGCSARHVTAKLSRPEGDVYVSVHVEQEGDHDWAEIVIVEVKPMESGLVTVNAASLANDITRTGHASVYGIYFDTGKADVKPESDATLKEIATLLQQNPSLKLYVVGHTDNQGNFDSNIDLSRKRGDAVLAALTTKYGASAVKLRAAGDGPTAPVASNDTEEGRSKNRRVELVKQ